MTTVEMEQSLHRRTLTFLKARTPNRMIPGCAFTNGMYYGCLCDSHLHTIDVVLDRAYTTPDAAFADAQQAIAEAIGLPHMMFN